MTAGAADAASARRDTAARCQWRSPCAGPALVCALALLEGGALGLSPAALDWTRALRDWLVAVRNRESDDAVSADPDRRGVGTGRVGIVPEMTHAMARALPNASLVESAAGIS